MFNVYVQRMWSIFLSIALEWLLKLIKDSKVPWKVVHMLYFRILLTALLKLLFFFLFFFALFTKNLGNCFNCPWNIHERCSDAFSGLFIESGSQKLIWMIHSCIGPDLVNGLTTLVHKSLLSDAVTVFLELQLNGGDDFQWITT